jgi:hypothetical protein
MFGNCVIGLIVLIHKHGLGRICVHLGDQHFIPHCLLKVGDQMWHFTKPQTSPSGPIWEIFWFRGHFEAFPHRHYERWLKTRSSR